MTQPPSERIRKMYENFPRLKIRHHPFGYIDAEIRMTEITFDYEVDVVYYSAILTSKIGDICTKITGQICTISGAHDVNFPKRKE